MESILLDIRYGLRTLMRQPRFTVLALLTLALGIGASSSIFSVLDGVVLRPLPYFEPDELVVVFTTSPEDDRDNVSPANYLDWCGMAQSFDGLAAYCGADYIVMQDGLPLQVDGTVVTNRFFQVLAVEAVRGRIFSPELDPPDGERVVMITYGYWMSRWAGDETAVGSTLTLDGEPYTIVGILPPAFAFSERSQIYTASRWRIPDPPVNLGSDPETVRGAEYFHVVGRLKEGVARGVAQQEMNAIAAALEEQYPEDNHEEGINLVPLHETVVEDVRTPLLVLMAAVGFVLLIACANVANLLLVRAMGRTREIAVRSSLGAGRARLFRQLVTESVLLSLAGGFLGFLVALWGTDALLALAPEEIPRSLEIAVNLRVLLFTVAVAVGTGILFGLVPGAQALRGNLHAAIREAGGRSSSGRKRSRLRNTLVIGEVAVSLTLLVGAMLLLRTLGRLQAVETGFDPRNVLTTQVWVPQNRYPTDEEQIVFYRRALENVRAIPGVERAGAVLSLPLNWGIRGNLSFEIEGYDHEVGDPPACGYQLADHDYFATMGIPLVRGRGFEAADDENGAPVAIVNEAAAREFWGDEDPLGRRVTWGDADDPDAVWSTIVGVVAGTVFDGLDEGARSEIFRPFWQAPMPYLTFVVKGAAETATLVPAVRRAVMEVDPEQSITEVMTMEEVLRDSLGPRRFSMQLIALFALAALLLAAIGLYGVLSYSVTQRANEIGIRMALGASTGSVLNHVMKEGFLLVLFGLAAGIVLALVVARVISSMIFGVSPADPVALGTSVIVMAAIALAASAVPAVRATRTDPATVLRAE